MARQREPYEYRRLSAEERRAVVEERKRQGFPWHSPPHFPVGEAWYLLSAATFEHKPILATEDRRLYLQHRLLEGITQMGGEATAWVVLPNHYHALARVPDIMAYREFSGKLHRGTAYEWNRVDRTPGRKVWFRFSDRQVRGERSYFTYFNYVHGNPVKHGWAARADEWLCSSLKRYLQELGRDYLKDLWNRYPPRDTGKGWDDFVVTE